MPSSSSVSPPDGGRGGAAEDGGGGGRLEELAVLGLSWDLEAPTTARSDTEPKKRNTGNKCALIYIHPNMMTLKVGGQSPLLALYRILLEQGVQ